MKDEPDKQAFKFKKKQKKRKKEKESNSSRDSLEFHKKMCMTETHQQSLYNHGEYELLIKMDSLFEDKYIRKSL